MGRGRSARSKALIARSEEILQEIRPATVRAVCYRLFSEGLIPSMEKSQTNKVSGLLARAREEGTIPWEWIVDNTRTPRLPNVFASPRSFAKAAQDSLHLDPWESQQVRVQVWSEKDTVSGTLQPVLNRFSVRFRVNRGFTSATAINDIVNEIYAEPDPRPLVALYVGDYDPSGLYMSEKDLPRCISEYGFHDELGPVEGFFTLRRVALVEADLKDLEDLSFPVSDKASDPRYSWYRKKTRRSRAWELDAMSPVALRERVAEAIAEYIEPEAWDRVLAGERAVQQSFDAVLTGWTAIQGQAHE